MKKIFPYIFIIITVLQLVILSSPAQAQETQPTPQIGSVATPAANIAETRDEKKGDDLYSRLPSCNVTSNAGISGCFLTIMYHLIYEMPMTVLMVVGYLFNAMLALTLSSAFYGSTFISEAWRIVRDFSNIFFILILLYISIKMILGLGGAEVKRMIANVVVLALLINFSMFFTKIVIDASNILALIFYNKIDIKVNGKTPPYSPTLKTDRTEVVEKDFSGGIVGAFDPSKAISDRTFKGAERSYLNITNIILGSAAPLTGGLSLLFIGAGQINVGVYLMVILVSAIIALFASYALFIASIAFMGRLIELWLCIIFSPFAFMSIAVPKLKTMEYLGWDAWQKRLLGVAFMAPIFMFFLLLISKVIQAPNSLNSLVDDKNPGIGGSIMLVVIPAIIYITLLWKATDYARKAGGEFANVAIKVVDGAVKGAALAAGALGLAAATGGVSLAGTATLGSLASKAASSTNLLADSTKTGFKGFKARALLRAAEYGSKASFDPRKAPIVGGLMKKIGVNPDRFSVAGGYEGRKKRAIELGEERQKKLKVGDDDPLMHDLHKAQENLQSAENAVAETFRQLDDEINAWKEKKGQAVNGSEDDKKAAEMLKELNGVKGEIKAGIMPMILKFTEGANKGSFKDANGNYNFRKNSDDTALYATHNGLISDKAIEDTERKFKEAEAKEAEAEKVLNESIAATKARIEADTKASAATTARVKAENDLRERPTSSDAIDALKKAIEGETQALKERDHRREAVKIEADKAEESRTQAKRARVELQGKLTEVKTTANNGTGFSIKEMNNVLIPGLKTQITDIENKWKWDEADRIQGKKFWGRINHKVAHKMRMAAEVKQVAK